MGVVAVTASGSFLLGQARGPAVAHGTATRAYTLRIGDKATIPAIGQVCKVETEGGAAELFCARPRKARHQVTIFRDNILVWTVGDPDNAAWSGKP